MSHMFLFKLLESKVGILTLNKAAKQNCINAGDFSELRRLLTSIQSADVNALIVEGGDCKSFTTGLDLKNLPVELKNEYKSPAHKSLAIQSFLKEWQSTFSLFEQFHFPVIACVHGYCIGLGIDLISAVDIRFSTKDAKFSVAEIDVGLAADVGTLQRLPKIVGNQSLVRELCFTGRFFNGEEAFQMGLCSQVFETKSEMFGAAMKLAEEIAKKDKFAVHGTKKYLVEALNNSTQQGLDSMLIWNACMLQNSKL
eukprot:NODE_95_length_21460_cov_0.300220.p9 type:complete len:254 gc:universal NODE_95_length_21460_cov_0.300220:21194-20433(-)